MIAPSQVAAALERLDPRDRELLALSLRRRVPDEALGLVYEIEPPEVARRRAAAIDRLAGELGVQRGEQLGAVLKALLEEETWSGPQLAAAGAEFGQAGAAGAPVPRAAPETASETPRETPERRSPETPPPPERAPEPPPVTRPEQVWAAGEVPRRRIPHLALALTGLGLAALAGALAVLAISQLGDEGRAAGGGSDSGDGTRLFLPTGDGAAAAPFPSDPADATCYPRAHPRGRTVLYDNPDGKKLRTLGARTEWTTPRVFGVIDREGDWLAVQAPELANDAIGWMRADHVRIDCVRWSLHVDLSKRILSVRHDGETVKSFAAGVGRRGNATPEGRFSVTDKLRVTDRDSPYGCCVVALTGHQTRLPATWPGGDRLAVHATTDLASIGRAATLGCLRVKTGQARWLIETVPLGAPVFVES